MKVKVTILYMWKRSSLKWNLLEKNAQLFAFETMTKTFMLYLFILNKEIVYLNLINTSHTILNLNIKKECN